MGRYTPSTRRGFGDELMNSGYVLPEDESLAIARRNARVMVRQGARPQQVAAILGWDLRELGLCGICGAERPLGKNGRRLASTCGLPECVRLAQTSGVRGKPRSEETRRRIAQGNRRSPKRAAQWEAMKGRELPDWWRQRISEGHRRRKEYA